MLPGVGEAGQERLRSGRVTVVGAGGIGSAALFYLAAAGVGRLTIVDGDTVELSNLQRQILHRMTDLGRAKVDSAKDALIALNPHCQVEIRKVRLDAANISEVLEDGGLVLDASDNFPTRFLIADYCWLNRITLVSAAVAEFTGQLLVVDPEQGSPCYRCLLPEPPEDRPRGILGSVAGVLGCLQATEAVKLLLGWGSDLVQALLTYDALKCRFHVMPRARAAECPLCGENPKITGLSAWAGGCAPL
ncbi:MAG: HesA/MoeB/ThiF family protein [Deltaproteobacteria bacterium]|nr:HesA/MoeB/ThiF family protein [Deltaproteobacteria bacterium]